MNDLDYRELKEKYMQCLSRLLAHLSSSRGLVEMLLHYYDFDYYDNVPISRDTVHRSLVTAIEDSCFELSKIRDCVYLIVEEGDSHD